MKHDKTPPPGAPENGQAALTASEVAALKRLAIGKSIIISDFIELASKDLADMDLEENMIITPTGRAALASLQAQAAEPKAVTFANVTAKRFYEDHYEVKINRGECNVLWQDGSHISSLRKMAVDPTGYEVSFRHDSSWAVVTPEREFRIEWQPVRQQPALATAGGEDFVDLSDLLTHERKTVQYLIAMRHEDALRIEALEAQLTALEADKLAAESERYEELTKTVNDFDRELTGRLAELQAARLNRAKAQERTTSLANKVSMEIDRLLEIARGLPTANNISLYGSIDRLRNAYSEALAATGQPAVGDSGQGAG